MTVGRKGFIEPVGQKHALIDLQVVGRFSTDHVLHLRVDQWRIRRPDRRDHFLGNLQLDIENPVGIQFPVEGTGRIQLAAAFHVGESGRYSKIVVRPTHGALKHVVGLKLIFDVAAFRTVAKARDRTRRDYEKIGKLRQKGIDILSQPIAEKCVGLVGSKLRERDHGDPRPCRCGDVLMG